MLISDRWMEDDALEAEELLNTYMDKYEHLLEEEREKEVLERANLNANLKLEFEKYILHDEDFLICTNQQLRKNYAKTILDKNETKKFRDVFKRSGFLDRNSVLAFVESIWKKYQLKNKK